jgi:hypothetical protein
MAVFLCFCTHETSLCSASMPNFSYPIAVNAYKYSFKDSELERGKKFMFGLANFTNHFEYHSSSRFHV